MGIYSSLNSASSIAGTIGPANGGTGVSNPTAHAIAVAEGSSNFNFVSPATSGTVLQGQGATSDPAFSTATYPATTTANQILYSSATNTIGGLSSGNNGLLVTSNSGVPSILAGPGTTGQVLQANASAAPSFSTATYPSTSSTSGYVLQSNGTNFVSSGNSPSLSQNAVMDFYDDLQLTGSTYGLWNTAISGTQSSISTNSVTAVAGHPGIWVLGTGNTSTGYAIMSNNLTSNNEIGPYILGAGTLTCTWYFNLPALSTSSQRYILTLGITNLTSGSSFNNGCYLTYSDNSNSGDWVMNCQSGGTTTSTNSTTAVATGWQVIQVVVNAGATSVSFYAGTTLANLSSLGSAITSNIPTTGIGPIASLVKTVGTTNASCQVDLVTVNMPLTTAR